MFIEANGSNKEIDLKVLELSKADPLGFCFFFVYRSLSPILGKQFLRSNIGKLRRGSTFSSLLMLWTIVIAAEYLIETLRFGLILFLL